MTRIISLMLFSLLSWKAMGQCKPRVEFVYQDKGSNYRAQEDTTKAIQQSNGEERTPSEFERKQRLLALLEDYKTAYAREDYELLDLFLSKSSLIIDGKMIGQNPLSGSDTLDPIKSNPAQLAQQGYLIALKSLFDKNEEIEVTFSKIKISQHPRYSEIYGVNLIQSWKSNSYADEGYLFLMIDFNDASKPVIQISAWQSLLGTSENEIIELSDSIINK